MGFDSAAGNGGYPPSGINITHSLGYGVGNNRIVLVKFHLVGGASHTVNTCTYNGTPMNYLTHIYEDYFSRRQATYVYYLLDEDLPSTANDYTVVVNVSGPYDGRVVAISHDGVEQVEPPYAESSDYSNPAFDTVEYNTNITVAADSGYLVDAGGAESNSDATAQTPSAGQTERDDGIYNASMLAVSTKPFTSSGSNSMGQTPNGEYWSFEHIVVELADALEGQIALLGNDSWLQNSSSISQSYTCHDGENRKLLVAAGGELIGGADIVSVSYDGDGLTPINEYDGGTHNSVSWWRLEDADFPTTPGSYTLACTFSTSMAPGYMMVMEIKNAKQGAVDAENSSYQANTDTLNTTITTLADDSWIMGFVTTGDTGSFTPDSGQTELEEQSGGFGGSSAVMGYEKIPTAGATGMQWLADSTRNRFIQMVIAVAPAEVRRVCAAMFGRPF